MTVDQWATTLSGFLAVIVGVGAGVRWLMKSYIHKYVEEVRAEALEYLVELKPNSGSSLNDMLRLEVLPLIKELRENQIGIGNTVAKLEGKFEQHTQEHA
jgi:hypothetical protein